MFADSSVRISLTEIYLRWSAPPLGVRAGLMPVYLTAFLLTNRGNLALYKEGIFVSKLTDADIDEYVQEPARFSLRWIVVDDQKVAVLKGVAKLLTELGLAQVAMDPLEAARGLVALVYGLPMWTQRTMHLGPKTRAVREIFAEGERPA